MQNSTVKITPEFVITATKFIKYVDNKRNERIQKEYEKFKQNYAEWKEIQSRPWYKRIVYIFLIEHSYSKLKDDSFESFKSFNPHFGFDGGYKMAMGIYRETYEVAKLITQADFWKNSEEAFLDLRLYSVINSNGAKYEN